MTASIEQALTFDPERAVGQVLGARYRVDSVLATGGMGLLFAGTDERASRKVAIKLLKPQDGVDESRVRRFLREVELAAQLRHPHIVDVLDLGTAADGRAPYLVMELMSGHSLQAELDRRGRLTPAETLTLLLPIMDALECVHAARVVHRDIKPANIFLSRGAYGSVVPKLIDFGIAKVEGQGLETVTGGLLGTPAYMAPEQLSNGPVGPWTDVWAMGTVFYRALSGVPPFVGSTPAEVIAQIVTAPAPALQIEGVKRTLGAAIDRALSRRPELRYPGMRAFSAAVLAGARSAGIEVSLPEQLERSFEGIAEEPTERQARQQATGAPRRFAVRPRALLAIALLILASAAGVLLMRDAPVAPAEAPAAAASVLAPPAQVELAGETASNEPIERTLPVSTKIEPARPPRTVHERAKPVARQPSTVADQPAAPANAELPILVEW